MTSIQSRIHAFEALSGSSQSLDNDWVAAPPLPPRQPSASKSPSPVDAVFQNGDSHTYPPQSTPQRPTIKARVASSSSSLSTHSRSSTSSSMSPRSTLKPMGSTLTTPSHAASSSISSMQSVSLEHSDADDESFESVSAQLSSFEQVSPIRERHELSPNGKPQNGALTRPVPPKLPDRPGSNSSVTSNKKPPPPPPPMRATPSPAPSTSSFASYTSSISSSKPSSMSTISSKAGITPAILKTKPGPTNGRLSRPTPVPPAARTRYLSLFDASLAIANAESKAALEVSVDKPTTPPRTADIKTGNQLSPPRSRQGWRGLSVDLTTTSPTSPSFPISPITDKNANCLHPEVVKRIWEMSRLPRGRLREIWEECIAGPGLSNNNRWVGRDEFAAGMWRIDEELRRRASIRRS